jgi:hypothetical protein
MAICDFLPASQHSSFCLQTAGYLPYTPESNQGCPSTGLFTSVAQPREDAWPVDKVCVWRERDRGEGFAFALPCWAVVSEASQLSFSVFSTGNVTGTHVLCCTRPEIEVHHASRPAIRRWNGNVRIDGPVKYTRHARDGFAQVLLRSRDCFLPSMFTPTVPRARMYHIWSVSA